MIPHEVDESGMKLLLVLAVIAGGAYLLVKSGTFTFYAYTTSTDANGNAHVNCYAGCDSDVVQSARAELGGTTSPVARDALALAAAHQDPGYTQTIASLQSLLAEAHAMSPNQGAERIRSEAPGLLSAMDSDESANLDRLRAAVMQTRAGVSCRMATLRLLARQQAVVRAFALDLGSGRPTWGADARFEQAMDRTDRLYDEDLRPCLAGASKDERAQVANVLGA